MGQSQSPGERILILAPTGRDAVLASAVFQDAGLAAQVCSDFEELCGQVESGAGMVLLTQETLAAPSLSDFSELLKQQPPWSDLPIMVLSSDSIDSQADRKILQMLRPLGNITLLERPLKVMTLISIAQTALRARRRQYEVRDLLQQMQLGVRQRDEFLAMLAHELRNPLAAVSSAGYLLNEMLAPDHELAPVRDVINRQTHHLTRLVDDLLDVSRITSGKVSLQEQYVDLNEVARHARQMVQAAADEHRHSLTLNHGNEPIVVRGDPARLEQVLTNLLYNAIKYTPDGGEIEVRVEAVMGQAVLRVRDSGIGIAPDKLEAVFDLFSQSERALDRSQGGLGIGLTVVRRLVNMHGGTVEAHSEGVGRGSEFVVRLPLCAVPGETVQADDEESANYGERHVLIVEDNTDARNALRFLLHHWGHRVDIATDGAAGINIALQERPEVALIDIGLPGINGYEVAQQLRQRLGEEIYLVALTGYGQPDDQRRALEAGFDLHLVKPVDLNRLRSTIDTAV